MTVLVFNELTAPMLSWVLSGADNKDYGSYVTIDIFRDDTAVISTNTLFARSMEMDVDSDGKSHSASIPASSISGLASAIDEGDMLTINVDDEKDVVYVSCGSTTITLDNMFDVTPQVPHIAGSDTIASVSSAYDVIEALGTAAKLSPASGSIHLDSTADNLSVSVVSDGMESKEVFPSTVVGDDEYHAMVSSKKLSALNALKKIDLVDSLSIKQEQGALSFVFPIDDPSTEATRLEMAVPTIPEFFSEVDSPCDEDITEFAAVGKTDIKTVLSPLTAVVKNAVVEIDTSSGTTNGVALAVKEKGAAAKTVVMDAAVSSTATVSVPLTMVMTALRNISTSQVILGVVNFEDSQWLTMMSSHDDDEDTGADLVIALQEITA